MGWCLNRAFLSCLNSPEGVGDYLYNCWYIALFIYSLLLSNMTAFWLILGLCLISYRLNDFRVVLCFRNFITTFLSYFWPVPCSWFRYDCFCKVLYHVTRYRMFLAVYFRIVPCSRIFSDCFFLSFLRFCTICLDIECFWQFILGLFLVLELDMTAFFKVLYHVSRYRMFLAPIHINIE